MNNLKEDIKQLADKQRYYRNQRKTVRLIGEREIDPNTAWAIHQSNRVDLWYLYLAYGELRGIPIEVTSPNMKSEPSRREIDRIKEKYCGIEEGPSS